MKQSKKHIVLVCKSKVFVGKQMTASDTTFYAVAEASSQTMGERIAKALDAEVEA